MNTEYRSIEVKNQTYILDEATASLLMHKIKREFGWVGTVFFDDDIRETIRDRRDADGKEPYTDEQLEEAVATIMDSWTWNKFMEDWMTKEGFEVLNTIIWDEIEYPEIKAEEEK
jgi:DNA modification methylase